MLLHIVASPKGERSASRSLADRFLATWREQNPDEEIDTLALFEEDLPRFEAEHAFRKFAPIFGEEVSSEAEDAWRIVTDAVARLDRADRILLSCPMWNYSIPWALKLYLDIIVQPRVTFGYNVEEMRHVGLLRNRPMQMILTRSSTMAGDYVDFQLPYLKHIFETIGIRDIRALVVPATTRPGAEAREAYVRSFDIQADAAARAF